MVDVIKRNNVRVIGEGTRTMVLAHGFGCDQNVWRYLINAFKTRFRLVLFDYVGAGQSDLDAYNPVRYNSLDGYAKDIIEILDALNIKSTVFVGHSVSSMIGLRASIIRPELFESLIFVTPSPCYINEEDYTGGISKEDLEALLDMMDSNYLGWSGTMAPLIMGNPEKPELSEELNSNFCATDPEIAREFARVTFLSDNRDDLKNVVVPSLTLQCVEDILAPVEVGHYMEKNTPGNTLYIMNASGHCPHLSAPEETVEAISSYLGLYQSV